LLDKDLSPSSFQDEDVFFPLIVKCTFCQNYFDKIIICKTIKKFTLINKIIASIKIVFLFIIEIHF